jgi:hypothetical protein
MLPGKDAFSIRILNSFLSPAVCCVSMPLPRTVYPVGTVMRISAPKRSVVYPLTGNQRAGYIRYA